MPFVGYGVYRADRRGASSLTSPGAPSRRVSAPTSASTRPRCARRSSSACSPTSSTRPGERGHARCTRRSTCRRRSRRCSRPPPRRRRRRVRADRRRDRVPAAGQPADPADQPPTTCPTTDERIGDAGRDVAARPRLRGILIGLGALVVLVPLGLLAPGGAFGEDSPDESRPQAVRPRRGADRAAHYSGFWSPRAASPATTSSTARSPNLGYFASAVVGTVLIVGVVFALFESPPCLGAGAAAATVTARTPTSSATRPACDAPPTSRRPGPPGASRPTGCSQPEVGLCPCGCIGKRRKGSFVAKTLDGASGARPPGDVLRRRRRRRRACCSGSTPG